MRRSILFLAVICLITSQAYSQIKFESYYDQGTMYKSIEGEMTRDSVRVGKWTWWHPNGKVFQQGEYSNGKKVGQWVVYYEDETLCAKEDYENGYHPLGCLHSRIACG